MKTPAIALSLLLLSGCATVQKGVDAGAEANDAAVRAAVFTLCRGASVGAIQRYFNTEELAQLWTDLCIRNQASEFKPGDAQQ